MPTYERLQDNLSKAAALDGVADMHFVAGRLDKALRIHREERLPIFERLAEKRRLAQVHTQIAAVLLAGGLFDEAFRTLTATVLRLWEELADVHSATVAQSRIGDIHQARGEWDEAFRVRTEVQLPVFERFGDLRSTAITQGQIATIWQARGQLGEALRLRTEEELPIYEQIGDRHCKAVALGRSADILRDLGQLEEALRRRRHEELPLYQELGTFVPKGSQRAKSPTSWINSTVRTKPGIYERLRNVPLTKPMGMAPNGCLPEYIPFERGGVLYEGSCGQRGRHVQEPSRRKPPLDREPMTLPGGPAAKIGHRYEMWWTLSELVRMLRGETDSLRLEPPGEHDVEFIVKAGGVQEYHQAKRSHRSGKWSVATLASAGVLASVGKRLIGNRHRFIFVSGSDARELADLCEGAAHAESFEEFKARFLGAESRASSYERVLSKWGCDGRDAWDALRRLDVRTTSERRT